MEKNVEVFDEHVAEYEAWFVKYPFVFQSEIEAVREMLPVGDNLSGIEIGLGTGQCAAALRIKEGVEPSRQMRAVANQRGIETMEGVAESLPYADMRFDFAVMLFCVSYLKDVTAAFREAYRVLKKDGCFIVGFLDKDSLMGKTYEQRKTESIFYKHATFFSVDKILEELKQAGFRHFEFNQTLFGELTDINSVQHPKEGTGEGSLVVVKALKKNKKINLQ